MPTAFWDIETRSTASLRYCGSYVYSIEPTTATLCLVYAVDDEEPQQWLPGDPPPLVFSAIAAAPLAWKLVAQL